MSERTDTEKLIVIHSTFVVGPDGREFDLRDGGFPSRKDYIAKNAYTHPIDAEEDG